MASNTLELVIKAQDYASKELKKIEQQVKGMKWTFQKTWNAIKDFWARNKETFKQIWVWLWVATWAIVVMWKKFLDLWTNIEQVQKKASVVFWEYIWDVQKVATETAKSMWLSQQEYLKSAAWLQDLLIPMGFAREEATKLTTDTMALSWALSEWSNWQYTAAEASEILAKAFLWETEQLKSMWIAISTWSDEFKALRNEIMETTWVTWEQAQALAIQRLILEKSTDAQNAFKEWSWSLARQQAELSASIKDARDSIAQALVPAFYELMKVVWPVITDIATQIKLWAENKENIEQVKQTMITAIEVIKTIWKWIWNTIWFLHKMWEMFWFVAAQIVIWSWTAIDKVWEVWNSIQQVWASLQEYTIWVFNNIKDTVIWSIQAIIDFAMAAVEKVTWAFKKIVEFKDKIKDTAWSIWSAISWAVSGVVSGARANWWPVSWWKTYLVWERWPELFTPSRSGNIIPNNQLWSGWTNININMWWVVVKNEADENRLVDKIKRELTRTIQLSKVGIS